MAEGEYGNQGGAPDRGPVRTAIRQFIRRHIITLYIFSAWCTTLKPLRFLQKYLRPKLQEMVKSWDSTMLWTAIASRGTRYFMDQNCKLPNPASFKPLIQTRPEWQFTEQQIKQFYEDGFIGPITLWTPEEMKDIRERVTAVLKIPSEVYPAVQNTLRDRYIDRPEFWEVMSSPQLVERLAQLLGPDLQIWRSQIFNKAPGDPEVTWHQASTYLGEQRIKPSLEPQFPNELYQLTTWIAIDDADFENGCMHFLKGTQRKMWTMRMGGTGFIGDPPEVAKVIGGQGRFAKASVTLEVPIQPETIVPMPLKSGQCVIFTERCIHGSPPNNSDRRRFGFVFRTIKTNVKVYRDETSHKVAYLNESYDLQNWGCAQLRGEDKFHLNRMIQPPTMQKLKAKQQEATITR
jgi:chlorinating enzyme